MANIAIHKDTMRLAQELEQIEESLKDGVETTLKDIRWTQLYIARAVLALADCVRSRLTSERPRWQVTATDTLVKWGTVAIIFMVVYLLVQAINSGFQLP